MAKVSRTVVTEGGALTAAATRIIDPRKLTKIKRKGGGGRSWQEEAWQRFDDLSELSYVCLWLGNNLSQCQLVASEYDQRNIPTGETAHEDVQGVVRDIAGGPAGQADLLARAATFLTVPGEFWVGIIHPELTGTQPDGIEGGGTVEEWHLFSDDEVEVQGEKATVTLPSGDKHEIDYGADILFRVHRPHPKRASEATSPARAALPIMREIIRSGQAIEAAGRSRIGGPGILVLPSEITMPASQMPAPDPDTPGLPPLDGGTPLPDPSAPPVAPASVAVQAEDFAEILAGAIAAAQEDPDAISANAPIILQAQGDYIDKVQRITFESDLSETQVKIRDTGLRRLARTMDVPAEVLEGVGDVNHWSAWAIDDAAIRTHVRPLLTIICDALTVSVLRPMLIAEGFSPEEAEGYCVWYDTTQLATNPDSGEDARSLYDRGELSGQRLREVAGFNEKDAPSVPETAQDWLVWAMGRIQQNPAALPALAPLITSLAQSAPQELDDAAAAGVPTAPAPAGGQTAVPGPPPVPTAADRQG